MKTLVIEFRNQESLAEQLSKLQNYQILSIMPHRYEYTSMKEIQTLTAVLVVYK